MLATLVSFESSTWLSGGCLLPASHVVFPLCVHIPGISLRVQISFSYIDTKQIALGPNWMASFLFHPCSKASKYSCSMWYYGLHQMISETSFRAGSAGFSDSRTCLSSDCIVNFHRMLIFSSHEHSGQRTPAFPEKLEAWLPVLWPKCLTTLIIIPFTVCSNSSHLNQEKYQGGMMQIQLVREGGQAAKSYFL